jgi:two-component system sensor histidine kinase UhpB
MWATPQLETPLTLSSNAKSSRTRVFLLELLKLTLFAAAYLGGYACSRYFSQRTGARLWLPDSILLCTLLFVPRKKWWLYILVTAPARFVPWVRAPAPAWFLWANWINDIGKAMLAAYLLQYATANAVLFKRVRQYATYLGVAVILAPLLSAFFGALVRLTLGHRFWPAFGQWYLGDALANLVITPTLFLWFSHEYRRLGPRLAETAVWATGFAICLGYMVRSTLSNESLIALYVPFPFLIWAAARLGAIGASSGLTLTSLFVILGLSQAKGPFYPIAHDMHFLQLFLAVLALPILFVATLFEERQAVEARLRENQQELNRNYERASELAGRLISAQEDERKRIARELHDDVNQRLAVIMWDLDALAGDFPDPPELASRISNVRRGTAGVADIVRGLSHELHSATLQILGFVKGLEGLCEAVSQKHNVKVDVEIQPLHDLPDDISLCLFRVAQEALNNAVKHGKASQIAVKLARQADVLRLEIQDTGVGFNPATVQSGLGLVSMRERLRMIGGSLALQSSPGHGTMIEATVDCAESRRRGHADS